MADGLDDAVRPDVAAAIEVGEGPGHARNAVVGPGRDAQFVQRTFEQVAAIGLLIPRNSRRQNRSHRPTGLAEPSLCQHLQTHAPDLVLLRQARRDIAAAILDGNAALDYLEEMPRRDIRIRWLPCISPFAEHWTQMHSGEREMQDDRATALTWLHRALTQESQAG